MGLDDDPRTDPVALDRIAIGRSGAVAAVLRALIDHAPVAVFVKDRDGRYLLANREFERIFGRPEAELLGRDAYDLMPEHLAAGVRANDREVLGRTEPLWVEETVPREGTLHTYVSVKFALRDAAGEPWATCGVATDISKERQVQAELEAATRELARSDEELARFAATASHDLVDPFKVIGGFARLLADRHGAQLDGLGRGYLQHILDGVAHVEELMSGVLDQAQTGSANLNRGRVALDEIVELACAQLRPRITETGARIEVGPLPQTWGDRVQLTRLFVNLLGNALKFSGAEPPSIAVSAERGESAWTMSVADEGIGVDPARAEAIFEPFERLHTEQEYSGSGLGLASCRRIVELHGGRIWVEPNAPRGSAFRFTLPYRDSEGA